MPGCLYEEKYHETETGQTALGALLAEAEHPSLWRSALGRRQHLENSK
jgi:hypothetical protein